MAWNGETYNNNYYDDGDGDSSDDEDLLSCDHCPSLVKRWKYADHLERVHKCKHCGNYMPKGSIASHISKHHTEKCPYCMKMFLSNEMAQHKLSHLIKCQHCNESVLSSELPAHRVNKHPLLETVGMIKLDQLSNDEFNKLVDEKRIYAKDGHLFRK